MTAMNNHFNDNNDVMLAAVPFFHVLGGQIIALFSFLRGVPFVFLPRFTLEDLLRCIEKYKVTVSIVLLQ